MSLVCKVCKTGDYVDKTEDQIICTKCGLVIAENIVVNHQTFSESSSGAATADGQFVSSSGRTFRGGNVPGLTRESREMTIENGRKRVQQMAAVLGLTSFHVEAAVRLFSLAVQRNFVKGRRSENVACACLYVVCRRQKTPHMLIDFADILHTNVTTLGHTFLNFCALLNLSVPTIDPSLYIERFASKLQFGDKLQNVANTALRLVQRMKRDWIITGRRPSGICGAALIIAARIHGFKRTVGEVVNIVRICDVTLRKRLGEFDRTASSNLTPEEFEVVELEQEMDPPCYTEGLQKAAKRKRKEERRKQKQGQREEREKQTQEENDKAKEKEVEDSDNVQTSNKADEIVVTKELQEEMELMLNTNEFKNMEADEAQQDVAETERSPSITTTNSNSDSVNSRKARKRRNRSDDEGEEEERDSVDKVISNLTMSDAFNLASSLEESAGSESVASSSQTESISCSSSSTSSSTTSTSSQARTQTHSTTNGGGDTVWKEGQPFYWELLEEDTGNLSELDDNELEGYIVKSEEEVAIKKQIWEELNVEYLKELEEKQKQDAIKFPNGKPERPPRKKRATGPTRQRPAKTAAAAAASVLERRTSSKINYEALKGLMSPSSFASARK